MAFPKHADGVLNGEDWDTVINALEIRLGTAAAGNIANTTNKVTRTRTDTTLGAGVTTFAAVGEYIQITGNAGTNTVATITGGVAGQIIVLVFVDGLVTITDDATGNANTVNLSAAFTSSANDIMMLISDATSWREISRSLN